MKITHFCSFILLNCLCNSHLFGQINTDGVVFSTDSTDLPHPSAILEVKSGKADEFPRGILLPTTTSAFTQENQPGLSYYLNTEEDKGIHYQTGKDNSSKPPGREYVKLGAAVGVNSMTAPDGSIIMYYGPISGLFDDSGAGKKGTIYEHCYICNSENGTPDLTGKFIVTGTPNATTGVKVGNLKVTVKEDNIAEHTHKMSLITKTIPHRHSGGMLSTHFHDFQSKYGPKMGENTQTLDRKKQTKKNKKIVTMATSSSKYTLPDGKKTLPSADLSKDIKVTIRPGEDITQDDGIKRAGSSVKQLEILPQYFTVVYLMRNERKKCETIQSLPEIKHNLSVAKKCGVTIKDNGTATTRECDDISPSAYYALGFETTDKGFAFPRMSLQQMLDIKDPENGLTVFVIADDATDAPDNSTHEFSTGYWYYDKMNTICIEDDRWRRLKHSGDRMAITEPAGTLLPYWGEVAPDGWLLCTTFVADRYMLGTGGDEILKTGGSNEFYIPTGMIPRHTHAPENKSFANFSHTHPDVPVAHTHDNILKNYGKRGTEDHPRPSNKDGYIQLQTTPHTTDETSILDIKSASMEVEINIKNQSDIATNFGVDDPKKISMDLPRHQMMFIYKKKNDTDNTCPTLK